MIKKLIIQQSNFNLYEFKKHLILDWILLFHEMGFLIDERT